MTLTSETNRVQYAGDGAQFAFPITFVYWLDADVKVVHTGATGAESEWIEGVQYTLTGGSGSTGTLTVKTSPTDYTPALGETLTIASNLADTQDTSLPEGGAFPSSSVEQQLDKIVRLIQQKAEALGRAIKLPISSTNTDLEVPDPESGKILVGNAAADGYDNKTLADVSAGATFPVSSTDNALVRFDGTSGTNLQGSGVTVDDSGTVAASAINFGNQNLGSYEEGTWTPVLTFTTPGDLSVTYSVRVGSYRRIGNMVVVQCDIHTSIFTHTTASGNMQITGLPFTTANVTNQNYYGKLRYQGITNATYTNVSIIIGSNSTFAIALMHASGQNEKSVDPGDMPSGGSVRLGFTMTYFI